MTRTSRLAAALLLPVLLLLAGCGQQQAGGEAGSDTVSAEASGSDASATPSPGATGDAASNSSDLPESGPVPDGFQPYSITYVSSDTGYVLGDAPCEDTPCTSVVRTTDAGKSWSGVPAPKVPLTDGDAGAVVSPPHAVHDLRFASASDGWAFGGALYATHDGAAHWHSVEVPGSVLDLATDGTTAYALVARCDKDDSECHDVRLFSSPADEDAWSAVSGVAGGKSGGASLSVAGGQAVVALDDAVYVRQGSSWTRRDEPCARNSVSHIAASATGSAVFALCPAGAAAGHVYVDVYRSTDAAAHWTRTKHGLSTVSTSGPEVLTAASPQTVALAAASLDLRGQLSVSNDGGKSWHFAKVPDLPQGWRYVGARSGTDLVALPGKPNGSVWSSDDAGRSWESHPIG